MKIETAKQGPVCVISLAGRFAIGPDTVTLRQQFRDALEKGERRFVLDLTGVPWLDSGAIGETVACHKRAMDLDGVVKLALRGRAHDLYTFYMLDRVFPLFEEVDEAIASFGAQASGQ